jgi:hypothetical protein
MGEWRMASSTPMRVTVDVVSAGNTHQHPPLRCDVESPICRLYALSTSRARILSSRLYPTYTYRRCLSLNTSFSHHTPPHTLPPAPPRRPSLRFRNVRRAVFQVLFHWPLRRVEAVRNVAHKRIGGGRGWPGVVVRVVWVDLDTSPPPGLDVLFAPEDLTVEAPLGSFVDASPRAPGPRRSGARVDVRLAVLAVEGAAVPCGVEKGAELNHTACLRANKATHAGDELAGGSHSAGLLTSPTTLTSADPPGFRSWPSGGRPRPDISSCRASLIRPSCCPFPDSITITITILS